MTRKEQIKEYISTFIEQYAESVDCHPKEVEHFGNFIMVGINWADRHPKDEVNWQQVRMQASIAAMQGIISNETRHKEAKDSWGEDWSFLEAIAKDACLYADNLEEELKLCKV